jgi:hypothetical protein
MSEEQREFGVYVTVAIEQSGRAMISKIEKTDVMIRSYGKWRRIAVETVKSRYPEATIVDYRPYGCNWISKIVIKTDVKGGMLISYSFLEEEHELERYLRG